MWTAGSRQARCDKQTRSSIRSTQPLPVLILSLDTTSRAGSAALLDDDLVRAVAAGDASRTHGERLPGELARVLADGGVALAAVDLLAVASGPGAFTGLRIGLATMQGIALALNRPVVGVSALEAMALTAFETLGAARVRIGTWMDAARGEVFAARYDVHGEAGAWPALTPIGPPEVAPPDEIWARWLDAAPAVDLLVGDIADRYGSVVAREVRVVPHPLLAPAIARLARRRASEDGSHRPHQLQPLYVRRPDVGRR